ncbi:hypothetical protein BpHYR1_020323 [Brachionus plicatilis]|uniref:Transmembrane protein n=1 Tax=Brachionus plicatilis TaxID=10195 RepID=A0A3M7Q837_BRAPC|nr:hypothetical protein BpHYR1_020323 [Brachionus plicatilis]
MALRNSPNNEAPARAQPYPTIRAIMVIKILSDVDSPKSFNLAFLFKKSTMSLNKNGTMTLSSLEPNSKLTAITTLILMWVLFFGQMNFTNFRIISDVLIVGFGLWLDPFHLINDLLKLTRLVKSSVDAWLF